MRTFLMLLLLILCAVPAPAQNAGEVGTVPEITAPVEPASQSAGGEVQRQAAREPSAFVPRAADPILDAGFWRSVLAGVIVTVVSALILRAIL